MIYNLWLKEYHSVASKKPVVHVPHFHDESLLDSDTCMSKSSDIDSPPILLLGEV